MIPESTARTLFGTTDVVGMTLNLDIDGISQEFEVVGIRQDSSAALINMTSGGMQSMEIPLSTLETFGYYVSDFSDFYIIGESNEYTSKIAKDSVSLLEKRHNVRGKGIILVQSFNDALAQVNSVLNYITIFCCFGSGNFSAGGRHWCYEYHARISYGADAGNRNP